MMSSLRSRRLLGLGLSLVLIGLVAAPTIADPQGPRASDRQIAIAVTTLLRKEHLTKHGLDDEMSDRCLKGFVKSLDPWKLYFSQSDIDGFNRFRHDLDDQLKKGDTQFAHVVFKTFLQRVDERVAAVPELLAMPHDFDVDEEIAVDKDKVAFPRTPAEAKEMPRQ